MTERVAVWTDASMCAHDAGAGHPERPDRLRAILASLEADPPESVEVRSASPVDDAWFERLHASDYVRRIVSLDGASARLDPDTAVCPSSIAAARLAAGAARDMVAALVDPAGPRRGFALVRPPGHHAERDRAMGFCLFGNIALAADSAIRDHGLSRVLIVDWDVHHGNGTQDLLLDRADIAVFDLHQDGIYPGSGAATEMGVGPGVGATVNVPMPGGCGDGEYVAALRALLVPYVRRFRPDLVLVSAGFDGHRDDPLAGQRLTAAGFGALCETVVAAAEEHCGGRIGLVLEGGYDLDALTASVRACIDVLAGAPADAIASEPGRAGAVIERVARLHELA